VKSSILNFDMFCFADLSQYLTYCWNNRTYCLRFRSIFTNLWHTRCFWDDYHLVFSRFEKNILETLDIKQTRRRKQDNHNRPRLPIHERDKTYFW